MINKLKDLFVKKECTCNDCEDNIDINNINLDELLEESNGENVGKHTKILMKMAFMTQKLTEGNKDITEIPAEELKDLIVTCVTASDEDMMILIKSLGRHLRKADKEKNKKMENTITVLGDFITSTNTFFNPKGKKYE